MLPGLTGLLLGLALSACGTLPDPIKTSPPPQDLDEGSHIAYIGSDENVYIIAPDGGDPQPITRGPSMPSSGVHRYQDPTWDPSSGALAFIELAGVENGVDDALVHILPEGSQETEVAFQDPSNIPIYLDWSPEGSHLTILSSQVGEAGLRLWIAGLQTPAREVDRGQPYYWDWSDDGTRLYTHVGGSAAANPGNARIGIFEDMAESSERLEWQPAAFRAPAYRPTRGGVVIAAERQGESQLLLLNDQGSFKNSLADLSQSVAFAWSPSGDQLAYVEGTGLDPHTFGQLSLLSLTDDGEVEKIETGLSPVVAFFWSPLGDRIAAFVPEILEPRQDQLVGYSRQSSNLQLQLVIIESSSGEWRELVRLRPTEQWLSVVAFHDQYQRSSTIWSPSGERLVYTSDRSGGESGVYVIDVDGSAEANLIAQGSLAFWSFRHRVSQSAEDE
jgi:Tol biopolymer transport system component